MRKSTYGKVGYKGSPDDIRNVLSKKFSSASEWTHQPSRSGKLVEGALRAHEEGRPENLRTLLLNTEKLQEYTYYPYSLAAHLLWKAVENTPDHQETLEKLIAPFSEAYKKELLTEALIGGVHRSTGNEDFFRLLHKNGADFDKAITAMHARAYENEVIERMRYFEARIAGTPQNPVQTALNSDDDNDMRDEILVQLLLQVTELTEEVKRQGKLLDAQQAKPRGPSPKP